MLTKVIMMILPVGILYARNLAGFKRIRFEVSASAPAFYRRLFGIDNRNDAKVIAGRNNSLCESIRKQTFAVITQDNDVWSVCIDATGEVGEEFVLVVL